MCKSAVVCLHISHKHLDEVIIKRRGVFTASATAPEAAKINEGRFKAMLRKRLSKVLVLDEVGVQTTQHM